MKNKVLKFVTLIIVFSMLMIEVGSFISYATDVEDTTTTPPVTETPPTTPTPDPVPDLTPTPDLEPTPEPEEPKNEVTNTPSKNETTSSNTVDNSSITNNIVSENNTVDNNVIDDEETNTVEEEEVEEKPEHIVSAETNYDRGATKSVDLSKVGIKNLKVYAINAKGKKTKISLEEDFEMQTYNYTCKVDNDVEKLEFEYTESNKDIKVEVIGNEDLTKSDNTIIILARDTGLGRIATYQIKVKKEIENVVSADIVDENKEVVENNTEEIIEEKSFFEKNKTFIIIGIVIVVLLFIVIILKIKQNKDYGKGKRASVKKSNKR